MKANLAISLMAIAGSLLCGCCTTRTPVAADYRISIPESADDRRYLGLPEGAASFRLEEIHCEVLVIDCFDMYCHICQAGAKHINELYRLAQERGLGARVKFVGLGLGDTPLEVATYKEKFKVPFPVFPDRRSVLAKQFGPVKLPNLIILRNQEGRLTVVHTSPGPLSNPADVLAHIQTSLSQVRLHQWNDPIETAQPTCEAGSTSCRNPALPAPAAQEQPKAPANSLRAN